MIKQEDLDKIHEVKAEKICSFDCGIYGICYCKAVNRPELCENPKYSDHLENKSKNNL